MTLYPGLTIQVLASESKCREIFGIYSTKKDNETPVFNDIGGNILHAAVLLSTSATNKDQADKSDESKKFEALSNFS